MTSEFFAVALFDFDLSWLADFWPSNFSFVFQFPLVKYIECRASPYRRTRRDNPHNPTQAFSLGVFVYELLKGVFVKWAVGRAGAWAKAADEGAWWVWVIAWCAGFFPRLAMLVVKLLTAVSAWFTARKIYGQDLILFFYFYFLNPPPRDE